MKAKKVLAIILSATMIFSSASSIVLAEEIVEEVSTNVETAAETGLSGSGTEEDPYLIGNIDDLVFFRNSVNLGETTYNAKDVYVALSADINMADVDWSVNIGDDCSATFDGIFDGQGYTIYNLNSSETEQKGDGYICTGLFGAIYESAEIKNLNIVNADINVGDYTGANVGIVAGFVYTGTGSIENVNVSGDIKICAPGAYAVGTIVGYAYYGSPTIENCSVEANEGSYIEAKSEVGGIVGYGGPVDVVNSSVKNLSISADGLVGGVAGLLLKEGAVSDCSVKNVELTTNNNLWANSAAVAVGTIASTEGITISNVDYSNVTANGKTVTNLIGSTYTEKPADVVPAVVAKVDDKYYTSLQDAIKDAAPDGTVEIVSDVTVDEWKMFWQGDKTFNDIIYIDMSGLTIDGNDHTLTVNSIVSSGNGNQLFKEATELNVNDLTINVVNGTGGIGLESGSIKNVTFNGGTYGIYPGEGDITIEECTFSTNGTAIYFETARDNLVVTKNTFSLLGDSYAIILRGAADFTDNTVISGKVNLANDASGTVSGNDFNDVRFKVYNGATATIKNNEINVLTFNDESEVKSTFVDNTLSEDAEKALESAGVLGDTTSDAVAKIGETTYDSLDAALDYAKSEGMTEVEITVLDDIALSTKVKEFTKVTFTGTNREQTVDMNLNSSFEDDVALEFNDLTVSRLDKEWLYHYTYVKGGLTYNNCKMIGLFNVTAQDTNFVGCDFYNDDTFGDGNYSIWLYNCFQGVEVNIIDCTFDVYERAIKAYGNGYNGKMVLNILGTEFTSRTADKTVVEMAYDNGTGVGSIELNITESTAAGFGAPEHIEGSANAWFNVEGADSNSTVTIDNTQAWPIVAWDGVTISNLDELKMFRDAVNGGDTYKGKTVTLTADIDLASEEWTPIGDSANSFLGTFDGGNHTISNLVIEGGSSSNQGFFGVTKEGEIKNLTINNAKVSGRLNVGVLAGTPYTSKYTNIKLTGHVEVNGMAYVGGVGGKNVYANWTDITVDVDSTSYVKAVSTENGTAYRTYVGGVIGFMGEGGHKVSNVTSNISVYGDVCDIGGIAGIAHYGNTFENCTATGKVEHTNPDAPAEDRAEVGGIAGVWHNQQGYTVTFANCKYEGSSEVAAVGAAYSTSKNTADTSGTLIIDGAQAWPVAAKIGNTTYASLADALAAATDGDIITLLDNVELAAPVTIKKSITIDGGGYTITQSAECNNAIALIYFEGSEDNVLNVTVKNTTFDGLKTGAAIRTLHTNITADNCVFQNCEHTVGQGLVRLTYGTANITNSKFIDNECSMGISFNWDADAGLAANDSLTINNCEFTDNTANKTALVYYVKGASCEIKNSEFKDNIVNCNANGATIYLGFQENCSVTGNIFENNSVTEATSSTRVAGAIFFGYETEISGNVFVNNTASNVNGDALGQICTSTYYECDINLDGNYWGGEYPVYGVDYTVQHQTGDATFTLDTYNASYQINENGDVVLSDEKTIAYVAKVGKFSYTSLQSAVDAAKTGDTITLISDVEMTNPVVISGKSITLDLGEYTIYDKNTSVLTSSDDTWGLIALENGAKLIICGNGTIDCNYVLTNGGWTGMAYCVDVDATSELTINSGCFTNGNGGIQTRGKVTVNNGTFVSHNGGTCIMATGESANVTVNDGIFKDFVEDNDVSTGSGAVWTGFGATVNIKGGTYDFAADPEHDNIVWTLFPAQNAIAGYGSNANMTVSGGTFVNFNPATDVILDYSSLTGFTFGSVVADGYVALKNLDGNYIVGAEPTATVNDMGALTVPAGEYTALSGSNNVDMPLSFVMQFLADQTEEDMATSPYAEWYGDFVITFTGLENGSFNAEGCYLAGYYGEFGWVKVPVDGILQTIEEGVRYPVMLGVGMGQKYDYICTGVKDFRCAMFLPEEVLAANPNIKVNLELSVVDNSKGDTAALEALAGDDATLYNQINSIEYTADDFKAKVASVTTAEGTVTNYTDIEAALKALKSGDTLTLLDDVTVDYYWDVRYTGGKITVPVTIDGNGHTMKFTNTVYDAGNHYSAFRFESDATVKNLTIDMSEAISGFGGRFRAISSKAGDLTVDNCKFIGNGSANNTRAIIYGENVVNDAETDIVITNSEFIGWRRGISDNEGGKDVATVKVEGNTFTDANVFVSAKTSIAFNNNEMNDGWADLRSYSAETELSVVAQSNTLEENGTTNYNKIYNYATKDVQKEFLFPVAKNGTKQFFSLAQAIEAAAEGDTVTLLSDVVLEDTLHIANGKKVTLDLAGKTISQTKEQTEGYQMILNDGNLTIDDTVGGGKISYTDSGNGGEYISDTIYNRATLVINGGTIENLSSATVAGNGYPHTVDAYSGIRDTSVTINGGTIYCAEYSAIRMFCVSATNKADLVINDGTVKGAIDMQNGITAAALGTLTINGGTFETTKNANNIRFANWNGSAAGYGITASITGGNFNGGITTQYVPAAADFNSKIVSGGTFASNPGNEFAAEGFEFVENADGTYGVQKVVELLVKVAGSNVLLQDLIKVGYYVQVEDVDFEEIGGLVWTADEYNAESDFTVNSANADKYTASKNGAYYSFETNGIYAQNIDTEFYMIPYIKTAEGYSYGEAYKTSVLRYAEYIMKSTSATNVKAQPLVKDLLNYATAARAYFVSTGAMEAPEKEFNAILTDEQKAVQWNESMKIDYESDVMAESGFDAEYAGTNVNLQDAITFSMYYSNNEVTGAHYWISSADVGNSEAANETVVDSTGGFKRTTIKGIYSYNIYDDYYLCAYNNSGAYDNNVYAVSVAGYLTKTIENPNSSDILIALCKAMQVYGTTADTYFSK